MDKSSSTDGENKNKRVFRENTRETALVPKNEYENIHKVFNIKGLNIRFSSLLSGAKLKARLNSTKAFTWLLKGRLKAVNYKAAVILSLIVLNVLFLVFSLDVRYKVYMNEQYLGAVDSEQDFSSAVESACSQISAKTGFDVCFESRPVFKPMIMWKFQSIDLNNVAASLISKVAYRKKGYAVNVNGKEIVVVDSRQLAEQLLEKLKEPFRKTPGTKVEFVDDVRIEEKAINEFAEISFEEALSQLTRSEKEPKVYRVQKGDSLWVIARNNGMTIDQIAELNPGLTEVIKEGQEIKLERPVPLIKVKTTEVKTVEEKIPFDVIRENDSSRYRNQRIVISRGIDGQKLVNVEIVKVNGMEVDRNVLTEKVLKQPIAQKEKVGTKLVPPKWGTGSFERPVTGLITSRFGRRWGRMHEGIDIDGNVGDPIYAADGGKVIFAGYEGGYGKLVKIDHDNEFVTYYGHCSKILVKEGSRVSKGQKIGLIGMTGRTTGPHLHFEIRKNGVPRNPTGYLE